MHLSDHHYEVLAAELAAEVLQTGLSVEEALQRLLEQGIRDLERNRPDVYASVCRQAAEHGLSVADFVADSDGIKVNVDRVRQRAEEALCDLREDCPYGVDPKLWKED